MAFLLILRRNQDEDLGIAYEAMLERFQTWTGSLAQGQVLRSAERLKPASEAVTVRLAGDDLVTGGRYDVTEDVIGYYLIDVASVEEAQRIAADCPILAAGGSVEIRETDPFMSTESPD